MADEQTVRMQQKIELSRLKEMIAQELELSGDHKEFILRPADREGFWRVNVDERALKSLIDGGVISIVNLGVLMGAESLWNSIKGTYELDPGEDIEDIF